MNAITPLSLSHTPLPLPPGVVSRVMGDNAREGLQDAWVGGGGQIHGAEHPTFSHPYKRKWLVGTFIAGPDLKKEL